tara:strand:- start:3841 stop:4380 length:540 start_codon:yes stop_codon:yes gene_type:complete
MLEINNDEMFHDVKIISPKSFEDSRGFFSEIYNKKNFETNDLKLNFIQDNLSFTKNKNVIRGLHFQYPPYQQDKLVRVLTGEVLDVFVDIRKNSKSYGQYNSIKLNSKINKWILVPKGFAHGFITLTNDTTVLYKVTEFYKPDHENGIIWNDKDLNIDWGCISPELSDKDKKLGTLNEI